MSPSGKAEVPQSVVVPLSRVVRISSVAVPRLTLTSSRSGSRINSRVPKKSQHRGKNFTDDEVNCLLTLVAQKLPRGSYGWEGLTAEFKRGKRADDQRDMDALKSKFIRLKNHSKPTGDPDCPEEVRRAKRAQKAIDNACSVVSLDDDDSEASAMSGSDGDTENMHVMGRSQYVTISGDASGDGSSDVGVTEGSEDVEARAAGESIINVTNQVPAYRIAVPSTPFSGELDIVNFADFAPLPAKHEKGYDGKSGGTDVTGSGGMRSKGHKKPARMMVRDDEDVELNSPAGLATKHPSSSGSTTPAKRKATPSPAPRLGSLLQEAAGSKSPVASQAARRRFQVDAALADISRSSSSSSNQLTEFLMIQMERDERRREEERREKAERREQERREKEEQRRLEEREDRCADREFLLIALGLKKFAEQP